MSVCTRLPYQNYAMCPPSLWPLLFVLHCLPLVILYSRRGLGRLRGLPLPRLTKPNERLCLLGSELAGAVVVQAGGNGGGGGGGALAEALLVETTGSSRSPAVKGTIHVTIRPHDVQMAIDTEMSVAALKVRAHSVVLVVLPQSCNQFRCNGAGKDRVGTRYPCRVAATDLRGCRNDGRAKGGGYLWGW